MTAGRQAITQAWWDNQRERFELRISVLVEEEASRGDSSAAVRRAAIIRKVPSLAISDLATLLAETLVGRRAIPEGSEDDALHIAIAATQEADFVLLGTLGILTMLKQSS